MNLRFADEHDAAACLAIYAQYIDTSITFETALPSEDEFAGRIRSYGAVYPWLIAEEDGEILAYAYATARRSVPPMTGTRSFPSTFQKTRREGVSAQGSTGRCWPCSKSRASARPTAL